MSHWTTVQTNIGDLDALEEALKKLGYKNIAKKTKCRGYGGSTKECDLVIVQDNGYDIGFKMNGGTCEIVGDFGMQRVNEREFKDQVYQKYSYCKILKSLKRKGFTGVRERVEKDGTIKLVVNLAGSRFA
jgi:hypothetical protein